MIPTLAETRVFAALQKKASNWSTSKELAALAGIPERTARAHLLKLARLRVVETMALSPAYRYRLLANGHDASYLEELKAARKVFGL